MDYRLVCGIETHVELATKTKIFCSCTTEFGGEPNTHCCPVCTGQPGTLPVLNREAVRLCVRAGIALNCRIQSYAHMDRKNYFYPDLPKAYQISQADEPVCGEGYVELDSGKKIGIERIHIEEDAGKLIHLEQSGNDASATLIDYNRAGVPLIEIVSKPDIASPEEAKEYAEKLQLILRYAGISDCKMQEGSMRCDVNLSLHREGEAFGTRTEIKNVNSFTNIAKAIKSEMKRQAELLDSGEKVVQATLRYDALGDKISIMRLKENSDDYRYFPEADIVRFHIPDEFKENEKALIPELPQAKKARYINELGLSKEATEQLYKYRKVCDFFESVIKGGVSAKNASNLLLKGIFPLFSDEDEKEKFDVCVDSEEMIRLTGLVDEKTLNFNRAAEILVEMTEGRKKLEDCLRPEDISVVNKEELEIICAEAVENNPAAAADIMNGKTKAINVLFGYIMKKTRGKADLKQAEEIIKKLTETDHRK